ncbi:unnamed protein product [Urochloa humidicola]
MYLAIPILLYAGAEAEVAWADDDDSMRMEKVAVYPGNMIAIHMSRPRGFIYKSGQYIYVNCGEVPPLERHSFIIMLAPVGELRPGHLLAGVLAPAAGQRGLLHADLTTRPVARGP